MEGKGLPFSSRSRHTRGIYIIFENEMGGMQLMRMERRAEGIDIKTIRPVQRRKACFFFCALSHSCG